MLMSISSTYIPPEQHLSDTQSYHDYYNERSIKCPVVNGVVSDSARNGSFEKQKERDLSPKVNG